MPLYLKKKMDLGMDNIIQITFSYFTSLNRKAEEIQLIVSYYIYWLWSVKQRKVVNSRFTLRNREEIPNHT